MKYGSKSKMVKPKVKKGDNEEGSFINLCLCYHENEIILAAKSFIESKNIGSSRVKITK